VLVERFLQSSAAATSGDGGTDAVVPTLFGVVPRFFAVFERLFAPLVVEGEGASACTLVGGVGGTTPVFADTSPLSVLEVF
jgi:hypothetical protein